MVYAPTNSIEQLHHDDVSLIAWGRVAFNYFLKAKAEPYGLSEICH